MESRAASSARSRSGRAGFRSGARSRAGSIAMIVIARRRHLDVLALMDAIAPGVVLAQAIGRWGNYFNQELFGRPTKLPWGLEIDLAHRPAGYTQYATFHPTFLYESLWCLLIFATLLIVESTVHVRPGQVFALYVAMYTFGRTSSSGCASTTRRASSASGSTCCFRPCCASSASCVRRPRPPTATRGTDADRIRRSRRAEERRRPELGSGISPIELVAPTFRRVGAVTTTTPPIDGCRGARRQSRKVYGAGRYRGARARRRSTSSSPQARVHRDHGPVGLGQVDAPALPRRARPLDVRAGVPRRHRHQHAPEKELTKVRRDRIGFIFQSYNLIPTLNAMENITLPMALGGPQARRGVARSARRHRRPRATVSSTGRRSCRAGSSSASPSPARWRASPRSSSPTSRPATSTRDRAPRSSSSCATPCTSSARRS